MSKLVLNLILISLLACSAVTIAAPPIGSGGGYYGSAWFNSNQGIVVGPYSTWHDCNQALQGGIQYSVTNWGWSVTELNPCSYRPPFGYGIVQHELALAVGIVSTTPDGSLAEADRLLTEVEVLREAHRIDAYEAAVRRIR